MRLIAFVLTLACGIAWADVYKWTDANGKVHYGDKPRDQDKATPVHIEIFNSYSDASYLPIKNALKNNQVVLFSASWCTYCKNAADYFERNRIDYIDVDIEKNPTAKTYFESIGGTGLPVILYKTKKVTGFSVETFKKIYP